MKIKLKILTVLSIILIALAAGTVLIVHSQKQENKDNQLQKNQDIQEAKNKELTEREAKLKEKIKDNGYPIAEFDNSNLTKAGEIENTSLMSKEKSEIRVKRSKKYNLPNLTPENAKRFELNENVPEIGITRSTTRRKEPEFPISDSDFVLVGTVTDAKAFLSQDKTRVFSEFEMIVSETLKQSRDSQVSEKGQITLARAGGKVRLPSGKVLYKTMDGLYMPQVGKRYVMFLKYDAETNLYRINTGYEILNGKIIPLDGLSIITGDTVEQYQNYQKYKDVEETEFLNLVKSVISQKGL